MSYLLDIPSRQDLLHAWLEGTITLDEYSDVMNKLYPLSKAEAEAARARVALPTLMDLCDRMDAQAVLS